MKAVAVLLFILSSQWVNATIKVDDTLANQNLLSAWVEIKNGEFLFNEDATHQVYDEGYVGVLKLAEEANEKYKFRDGIIYVFPGDGHNNDSLIDRRIYYTAYDSLKSEMYRPQCGPDFSSMAWGSAQLPNFEDEIKKIANSSLITPKTQKVGWVGNTMNPIRERLVDIGRDNSDIFDFRHVPAHEVNSANGGYTSIPTLIENHAFLLDAPGSGYSGRLKFLLHSNRPLFYVERTLVEYFNEDLIPNFHYIPIKHDLSNLVSQYQWAVENPDIAKEIGHNALMYAQANLTHAKFVDRVAVVFSFILNT